MSRGTGLSRLVFVIVTMKLAVVGASVVVCWNAEYHVLNLCNVCRASASCVISHHHHLSHNTTTCHIAPPRATWHHHHHHVPHSTATCHIASPPHAPYHLTTTCPLPPHHHVALPPHNHMALPSHNRMALQSHHHVPPFTGLPRGVHVPARRAVPRVWPWLGPALPDLLPEICHRDA